MAPSVYRANPGPAGFAAGSGCTGEAGTGTIGPMESTGDVRASDGERDLVVGRLERAVGQGRLSIDEFEHRITAAYAATTRGELAALMRDLPGHLW